MRIRLRPKYIDEQLQEIYDKPHQHETWQDHRQRVQSTIALAHWFLPIDSVADLSCGDGYIIDHIGARLKYKGDFAPGYDFTGPIEETIDKLPPVDLFILSETIEHLDDPDMVLSKIRKKTKYLILTTPKGEKNDGNPQHYWGWEKEDMFNMLRLAGFNPEVYQELEFTDPTLFYTYQMWGCS